MDLKVVQGKWIRLPADFSSGDEPADPDDLRVTVVNPFGRIAVDDAVPVREGVGLFRYDYHVAADAPAGTWEAVWTATYGGRQMLASDLFEVLQAPAPQPEPVLQAPAPQPERDAVINEAPSGDPLPPGDTPAAAGPLPAPVSKPGEAEITPAAPSRAGTDTPPPQAARPIETQATSAAPNKAGGAGPREEPEPAGRANGKPAGSTSRSAQRKSRKFPWRKALLLLAAAAIVLASTWFIPRPADTIQSKIDRGAAAQKAGRADEAEQLYREVLAVNPDNKLALFNLGVAAQAAGRLDDAEPYYLKALKTDPAFLPALFNLAILQERLGRYEESEQTYRRILELSPNSAPAYINLGYLLAQMGRPEEARTMFDEAVKVDPTAAGRIPPDLRPEAAPPPLTVQEP